MLYKRKILCALFPARCWCQVSAVVYIASMSKPILGSFLAYFSRVEEGRGHAAAKDKWGEADMIAEPTPTVAGGKISKWRKKFFFLHNKKKRGANSTSLQEKLFCKQHNNLHQIMHPYAQERQCNYCSNYRKQNDKHFVFKHLFGSQNFVLRNICCRILRII